MGMGMNFMGMGLKLMGMGWGGEIFVGMVWGCPLPCQSRDLYVYM